MKKKLLTFIAIFYFGFLSVAQNNTPNYIKTITLQPFYGNNYAPIVPLGDVLELSFDDLEGDSKDYQYKIEHMTFDWEPSRLIPNQYINGFEQNNIQNYNNSFNTLQSYTHYSVNIPNESSVITKSGNYLISVIDENYEVVFTRRCVFYENITRVGVAVYRSRNTRTINEQQTVQFSVIYGGLQINNPAQEIKVSLFQNNNWQTAINNLQPQFFQQDRLVYNYTNLTNFWGGNEYLNFDTKSIQNTSINIARVVREDLYHHYLYIHEPKAGKPYTYNPDINGQYVIRTLDSNVPETEADYAWMHFSLDAIEPIANKDVYVYGAFNNFELSEENKMTYKTSEELYEASILLKQGFYNYTFATVDRDGNINTSEIDGSFYETENEYTVIVYYKPFGEIYDRVIGVGNGYFDQNR